MIHSFVAHGKNTGTLKSLYFSDQLDSKQSSLGLFLTGKKYIGSKGESLKLYGLDPGFNKHAAVRTIVMHGAPYVSDQYLIKHGKLGCSWGCPVVPLELAKPLIEIIKEGSVLFNYYPTREYFKYLEFLKC